MAINCFYIYSVSATRGCDLSSRRRHPKEGNYCDRCLWRPGLCTTLDISIFNVGTLEEERWEE